MSINRKTVLAMLGDGGTHRKQFSLNSGVQKTKKDGSTTFSVPFNCGLVAHFRDCTSNILKFNPQYNNYYCFLRTPASLKAVEDWEKSQGSRVFIRNLLSSSLALDMNLISNQSAAKTECGRLEELAKHHADQSSVDKLASTSCATISEICYLREADLVCAVPAPASKPFDLPRRLAESISSQSKKANLTPYLSLDGKSKSAKDCAIEEKWDTWEASKLQLGNIDISGKSVILLDDKYQSGMTMHYIAAFLLGRGAREIHGLSMVKTLRDTDNLDVVDV